MTVESRSPIRRMCRKTDKASLPAEIDQRRIDLLPLVLNERSRADLREHLSREFRATKRKRDAQLKKVGKYATLLRQALEAIGQPGMSWIAQEIGREEGALHSL